MNAVILVDPVSSGRFLKQTAHAMGYKVIVVYPYSTFYYSSVYGLTRESLCEECDQIIWEKETSKILAFIQSLNFSIKGCIPGNEGGVEIAEKIACSLGLLSNPRGSANVLKDKSLMREVLIKNNLSCPRFAICLSEEDVKEFAKEHSFPLVIKTPRGVASAQVFICENLKQLIHYFREITTKENPFEEKERRALIEEYIGGPEYIVDVFSDGKRTHVTDVWLYEKENTPTFSNRCVSSISIPLTDPAIQKLQSYALILAKAFQIERGPAHIEIKEDPRKGPTLIEIGGRLAGALLPEIIRQNSNLDLYQSTIEVFTKGTTILPDPIIFKKHLAIYLFSSSKSGVIKNILGLDQIQKLPSYFSHTISVKIGDHISETTSLSTHPGKLFLANADRDQLLQDIERAKKLFVLSMEKT